MSFIDPDLQVCSRFCHWQSWICSLRLHQTLKVKVEIWKCEKLLISAFQKQRWYFVCCPSQKRPRNSSFLFLLREWNTTVILSIYRWSYPYKRQVQCWRNCPIDFIFQSRLLFRNFTSMKYEKSFFVIFFHQLPYKQLIWHKS